LIAVIAHFRCYYIQNPALNPPALRNLLPLAIFAIYDTLDYLPESVATV
jgi:hypothetical protein